MLGIPLISDYIHKIVKPQVVADRVDFLNYYATSLLLALVALAISAKQYFGSPIQCWVPMEFRGGWEKYAEDYCFIQNSYYIPFTEQIPEELHERRDQISYYRWVPIVLALQALIEAKKCSTLHGECRDVEIRNLAEYIGDTVSVFNTRESFKLIYMLDHFFGGDYIFWGFQTLKDIASGKEWMESSIFPRVIMCDFQVRRLGNVQRHTVQCVIMMNMINEKFYLFLLFWLIFIGICTFINFLSGFHGSDMKRFVEDFLRPDGVLLLKFINEHVDARISRDLQNISIENDSKQTSSESSDEKGLLTNGKMGKEYYGNFGKNIKSLYPSKGGLPLPNQLSRSPLYGTGYETAPALEDFVDGTLPIRSMAHARIMQPQDHSTDNIYGSPGSQLRQSTPTEV
ncbi:Innexin [Dirofilaria immitis]|nr:Innexin [Dirofilaria immitis]